MSEDTAPTNLADLDMSSDFDRAIWQIRNDHQAHAAEIEAELRLAKLWAERVEVDYDEGPSAIGFHKDGSTYWYLIGDACWDADDPRSELLAYVCKHWKCAGEERDAAVLAASEAVRLVEVRSPVTGWSDNLEHVFVARFARERDQWRANHEQRKYERDSAIADASRLRAENEAMRAVVGQFKEAVLAAVRANEQRGKGGQHVSFHGDFANAMPSVLSRLEWWARAFDTALASKNGAGE